VVDSTDLSAPRLEQIGHAPVLSDGVGNYRMPEPCERALALGSEDNEHARRFGWYPLRSTLDGVRGFILDARRQWCEGGPPRTLAIRKPDTRTLVGGCETGLQPEVSSRPDWM
jgi:hypothetical protein